METLIWIDHHTTTPIQQKKNRAFTKTGLTVVFLFLHDEAWLNRTYRDIAEGADVALGNIKHVLDGLKEHEFVYAKNEKVYEHKNRDDLPNIAPRLVVYTDLMITGDPRNIKIATEIYAKTPTD